MSSTAVNRNSERPLVRARQSFVRGTAHAISPPAPTKPENAIETPVLFRLPTIDVSPHFHADEENEDLPHAHLASPGESEANGSAAAQEPGDWRAKSTAHVESTFPEMPSAADDSTNAPDGDANSVHGTGTSEARPNRSRMGWESKPHDTRTSVTSDGVMDTRYRLQEEGNARSWWEHWSSGIVLILLIIALVTASIVAFNEDKAAKNDILSGSETTTNDDIDLSQLEIPQVELPNMSPTDSAVERMASSEGSLIPKSNQSSSEGDDRQSEPSRLEAIEEKPSLLAGADGGDRSIDGSRGSSPDAVRSEDSDRSQSLRGRSVDSDLVDNAQSHVPKSEAFEEEDSLVALGEPQFDQTQLDKTQTTGLLDPELAATLIPGGLAVGNLDHSSASSTRDGDNASEMSVAQAGDETIDKGEGLANSLIPEPRPNDDLDIQESDRNTTEARLAATQRASSATSTANRTQFSTPSASTTDDSTPVDPTERTPSASTDSDIEQTATPDFPTEELIRLYRDWKAKTDSTPANRYQTRSPGGTADFGASTLTR